jgi:hypothetical protein
VTAEPQALTRHATVRATRGPPPGTCPRVKIPALRAGSFSLWSQRHVGVPGTPQVRRAGQSQRLPDAPPGAGGGAVAACRRPGGGEPWMTSAQNEANLPRSRCLTEEIVQNEAKLGDTGVYGQRSLSYGAWLGRGVKRAERSQFWPRAREWARVGGAARARWRAIVQNKANFRRDQIEANCRPEKRL